MQEEDIIICKCCGKISMVVEWRCHSCGSMWCSDCGRFDCTLFFYGNEMMCSFCCPPVKVFQCVICDEGQCTSTGCDTVGTYDQLFSRLTFGKCCKALNLHTLCDPCVTWRKRKICIILIGVRKFGRSAVLNRLPRDVLIYVILKRFVWNKGLN